MDELAAPTAYPPYWLLLCVAMMGHSCLIKQPPCCLHELMLCVWYQALDLSSGKQKIPPKLKDWPCCHLYPGQPQLTETSS